MAIIGAAATGAPVIVGITDAETTVFLVSYVFKGISLFYSFGFSFAITFGGGSTTTCLNLD